MKKLIIFLWCGGLSLFFVTIDAKINFGSKDSTLKIASGATFNVGSSNLVIDGTLKGDSSSSITGNPIAMNHGIIDFNNLAVEMLGTFDSTGADIIKLNGNNSVKVDPGTVIDEIRVQGSGNSIYGQPTLTYSITLADDATDLTMAIQSTLNKDIDLNGGTVFLGSQLTLADNVNINGPGIVDLKGYRLNLGGVNSSFTDDITFANATDLALHGNIEVTGTWTFSSDTKINGNGNIIDLSQGKFKINPGVTLYLIDVTCTGLHGDSSTGAFVFDDNTASIRSVNTVFELSESDMTTSRGRVYIDGESTFRLKDLNWIFKDGTNNDKGVLTVNSCLWLDVFASDACETTQPPGELRCPSTIFINHVYTEPNVSDNVAAGNLVLSGDCRIREVIDSDTAIAGTLVGKPLSCDIALNSNVVLGPNQQIVVAGGTPTNPMTLDGQGAIITFSSAADTKGNPLPQFIVNRGCAVRLKNITLTRLNSDSLEVQGNAQMVIGKNVSFELSEDLIFTGQEVNQPAHPVRAPGKIIVEGPNNIFKIRGLTGRKRFHLNLPDTPTEYVIQNEVVSRSPDLLEDPRDSLPASLRIFNLGSLNSLVLQDIEFSGLGFMDFSNRRLTNKLNPGGTTTVPNTTPTDVSIALAGNSAVDIDRDTKMNFDIEYLSNELVFTADGITLFGSVSFLGLAEQNVLNIRHMINDGSLVVQNGVVVQSGVESNPYKLGLSGNPGIYLSGSVVGSNAVAGIIFDDANLELVNGNANAFVVDINSFVRARRLLVSGNAIKQTSLLTDIDDLAVIEGKIDAGFARAVAGSIPRPTSAFIKMRDRQRKHLQHTASGPKPKSAIALEAERKAAHEKKQKIARPHKLKPASGASSSRGGLDKDTGADIARQLVEPVGGYASPDYKDMMVTLLQNGKVDPFIESRRFLRCTVNEFSNDVTKGFNLLMNGTTINQAVGSPITLVGGQNPLHVINVQGLNNVINVTGSMTIGNGTLNFDEEAPCALTFNFVDSGITPTIELSEDTLINVPLNSSLIFKGRGKVILRNGAEIHLDGQTTVQNDAPTRTQVITGVIGRAVLGLFDRAILTVDAPNIKYNNAGKITGVTLAKSYITGVGTVFVDGGASIDITNFGGLVIAPNGTTYAHSGGAVAFKTITQLPDDIIVEVRSSGEIRTGVPLPNADLLTYLKTQVQSLVMTPDMANARIMTGLGNTTWIFERDGKLTIRANGYMEFNNAGSVDTKLLDGGMLTRGNVRGLTFTSNSSIYVGLGGRLVLGPNVMLPTTRSEIPFIFDFEPLNISGQGSVEFVDVPGQVTIKGSKAQAQPSYAGFAGILQPQTSGVMITPSMNMYGLARMLVNTNPNLPVAIEYVAADTGLPAVRTRNGVSVALKPGDVLLSENVDPKDTANFGNIYGKNGTVNFVIYPNGTRS